MSKNSKVVSLAPVKALSNVTPMRPAAEPAKAEPAKAEPIAAKPEPELPPCRR